MAEMKIEDIRAMTDDQREDAVLNLKKERFNLRFQRATGQLEKRKDELFQGINRFVEANPVIDTQEMIDDVSDFKVQLTTLKQDIDKQHATEKRPHLDAGNAVDTKYRPIRKLMEKSPDDVELTMTLASTLADRREYGNAVSLEDQMLKMTDARMNYDAAISFYQKSMTMLRMAARKPSG